MNKYQVNKAGATTTRRREEKYGWTLAISLAVHIALALLILWGGSFLPAAAVIGGGFGGAAQGDSYSVGVIEDLGGGTGMVKPSIVPRPPTLIDETIIKEKPDAIPLPQGLETKKKKASDRQLKEAEKLRQSPANLVPTAPEPGVGGKGGAGGIPGRGSGSGSGVSIGTGCTAFGDSWYARVVEGRISSNWIRPPEGMSVEIVYSFYIAPDGSILGIKCEKSSGNPELDLAAERAIRASDPLAPPPPEFRGRPVQFIAQFIYPPRP